MNTRRETYHDRAFGISADVTFVQWDGNNLKLDNPTDCSTNRFVVERFAGYSDEEIVAGIFQAEHHPILPHEINMDQKIALLYAIRKFRSSKNSLEGGPFDSESESTEDQQLKRFEMVAEQQAIGLFILRTEGVLKTSRDRI